MAQKLTATLIRSDGSELFVDLKLPEAVYVGVISHNGVFYRWTETASSFVFMETTHLECLNVRETM